MPKHLAAYRPAVWLGAAVLTLGALFAASSANAAAPANTLIGNQATASYLDSSGTQQLASSNLVQTTVQQVGAFTLTTNNTLVGAGGTTVYASHTLTNTGNGTDAFTINVSALVGGYTFSNVAVYADPGATGLPGNNTPLCTAVPAATCTIPAQTVAGNGGVFTFVVAYTIPAGTANAAVDSANVVGAPVSTSPVLASYAPASITNVDTVNVTTQAAFSSTKSLAAPAVLAPGNVAWPTANTTGPSSGAACSTTFPVTQSASCDYAVYTINYKNTGAVNGAYYMSDTLPSGFTYVSGSAVWSSAGGVALPDAGGTVGGITYVQAGQTVSALVASVAPNVSGTISFVVLVNSTATVGVATTTNTATYDQLSSAHVTANAGAGTTSSNASPFTVTATYGVVLGSATGTVAGSPDTTAGTPNGTAFDLNTAATITAGGSDKFTQTVFNTGNASDTFKLSVPANTFPAGTTFTFFKSDGVTPLLDTTGNGVVDTGPVAAGANTKIVVQVTIPATTVTGGPFTVNVLATSVGNTAKIDATQDAVTAVIGGLFDLTNTASGNGTAGTVANGDVGPGPSPQPTVTDTTAAGTGAIFKLFLKNSDSIANTYNMAASQTSSFPGSLPAGWTVKFVAAGAGCAAAAAVAQPIAVGAGAQVEVDACVTPPVSQVAVTAQPVYFKATSTAVGSTGGILQDSLTDAVTVTVAATYTAAIAPNNSGQVAPGGTVVYAHTLTATGAQSCGTYTVNAVDSGAGAGWTYALFFDTDGSGVIDANSTPIIAGTTVQSALLTGTPQKILVREFAPGGATAGATDTVTVTATFAAANGGTCAPVSATDNSTVVSGQIRVVKTQVLDTACSGVPTPAAGTFSAALITAAPGQCVLYRVIATNQGTAPISNLSINDALPAYTSLVGATQPAPPCIASAGITGTAPAYASTGTTVSCGSATNSVAPGATLELDFEVRLNP